MESGQSLSTCIGRGRDEKGERVGVAILFWVVCFLLSFGNESLVSLFGLKIEMIMKPCQTKDLSFLTKVQLF
jgi:hypothetical protein